MRRYDFTIIFVINVVLLGLIALGSSSTLGLFSFFRITLGLAYLMFAPGYVIQAALLPRQNQHSRLERLALSIGLSVAVIPILGLTLDGPPGGIFLWQSSIFLTLVIVIFGSVALYRRGRLTGEEIADDNAELDLRPWWRSQTSMARTLFALILVSVVIGGIFLVYVLYAPSASRYFTEFYVVGPADVAAAYPLDVIAGQQFPISLGVVNQEGSDVTYSIQAQLNGQTLAGTAPFTLADGQSTSLDMTLPASTPGDHQLLEILLLRDNQTYRHLYLWLNVKSP